MDMSEEVLDAVDKKTKELELLISKVNWQHCHELLNQARAYDRLSLHFLFCNAYLAVKETNQCEDAKAFKLIADAYYSLHIWNQKKDSPSDKNTASDVFLSLDIDFYKEALKKVSDYRLEAALADVIWLAQKEREYATIALQAYMKSPISAKTWCAGGKEHWRRAIQLAFQLHGKKSAVLTSIINKLWECFLETGVEDTGFELHLASFMHREKLLDTQKAREAADKLKGVIDNVESGTTKSYVLQEKYYIFLEKLYTKLEEQKLASEILLRHAMFLVKDMHNPGGMRCLQACTTALHLLTSIRKADRVILHVDDEIERVKTLLQKAKENTTPGVAIVKPFDATAMIHAHFEALQGKTLDEAFLYLIGCSIFSKGNLDIPQGLSISDIATLVYMDGSNRQISTAEGKYREISHEETESYGEHIRKVVHGFILPVLSSFKEQGCPSEAYIRELIDKAGIIPESRRDSWTFGIYAGFYQDYSTSLHILCPQLEELVRHKLNAAGVQTSEQQKNGVEDELSLTKLMNKVEITQIFSEDDVFEMRLLFCDPRSENLRNKIAHSLMDDQDFNSEACMYAWRFLARLALGLNHADDSETAGLMTHSSKQAE